MGDLFLRAFLDGNLLAGCDGIIDSGNRRGHVKGNAVFFRDHGNSVGADFVRGVAVASDAVGADHYGTHAAGLQEMSDHVVGNQGERDAILMELPSGEPRTLEIWAGFGNDHFNSVATFDGHADDSQGGADTRSGKRAGVALRHYTTALG